MGQRRYIQFCAVVGDGRRQRCLVRIVRWPRVGVQREAAALLGAVLVVERVLVEHVLGQGLVDGVRCPGNTENVSNLLKSQDFFHFSLKHYLHMLLGGHLIVLPLQRVHVMEQVGIHIARLIRLQLAVVQTPVPADLHLALDVDAESVWEFEGVEEGVSDDGRPFVRSPRLQEAADHLGTQDAPEFV